MPAGSFPAYYNEALSEVAGFFPEEQQAKNYLQLFGSNPTALQAVYGPNQFLNVGANIKSYIEQRWPVISQARADANTAYVKLKQFETSMAGKQLSQEDKTKYSNLQSDLDKASAYLKTVEWGTHSFPGTEVGKYGKIDPTKLSEQRPYYQQPTPWNPLTNQPLTPTAQTPVAPSFPNQPFKTQGPSTPLPPLPTTPSPTTVPNFGIGSPLPGTPPVNNLPTPNQIPSITPSTSPVATGPTTTPSGLNQSGKGWTPWGGLLYNYPFNPYKPVSSGEPAIGSGNQALQSLMDKSKDLFSGGIPGGMGAGGGSQNWVNMF